jgi:trk system potassium uptake protein TrkA
MAEAHYLVATTSSDELNVAIALVARALFGTREVIALVRAPERAESFAKLGIRTVCQTTLVATAFRRLIELDAES